MSAFSKAATRGKLSVAAAAAVVVLGLTGITNAAPFPSNVQFSGTTVSFTLNEPADSLTVSVNGGAPQVLNGAAKGTKSFTIGSITDTFSIVATKNDTVGYRIPTGATTAAALNGLSQSTANGGFRVISDDTSTLGRFNSPRGVTSQLNPNQPAFGTSYVANSAAGSVAASGTFPARTLGDGLYALRADQSDAFGYGDTAKPVNEPSVNAATPYRITAGRDGNVYVSDFADANSLVTRSSADLNTNTQILAGSGGPFPLPAGATHGSTTAVYPVITASGLTLYTLDEDLTTAQVTGTGSTTDRNSVWRYDVGPSALPFAGLPTKVNVNNVLVPQANSDMDFGADGKIYLAQNRSAGNEGGLFVLNPDGTTAFNSLAASRDLLGNPAAVDILRNVQGMAVSPNQDYVALMLNNSDVAVVPLVNGIPDIANRLLIDTGVDVNSGRDIAFDAAGNILYVSSGQGLFRTLSPGGETSFGLNYNGTAPAGQQFTFAPEPTSLAVLAAAGSLAVLRRRRRAL